MEKADTTRGETREIPWPREERRRSASVAAGHIRRLQAFTSALSDAGTLEQIGRALFSQGIRALGARAGSLSVLDRDPALKVAALKVVEAVGYPEQLLARWRQIPMSLRTPLTDALQSGEPIWLDGSTWEGRYPALVVRAKVPPAAAALPLIWKGERLGAIGLTFSQPCGFSEDDKAFFVALAQSCAQSIERVYLAEEERKARAQADQATARLELLSEFSRALAEAPVERSGAFDQAVNLLGEPFSQACSLFLLSEDGATLERVARYYADPGVEAVWEELGAAAPIRVGRGVVGRVAHSGASVLMSDATEALAAEAGDGNSPNGRAVLSQFPIYSLMVVPLFVQGSVGGVLHVSRHRAGSPYSSEDLAVMEELAERVGLLVGKIRLLEDVRAAVRLRDDFLSIASHELKTPLTSLRLQQELLQRGLGSEPVSKLSGRVEATLRQVSRLTTLVESLLDVSRITAGTLKLEPVPLDFCQALRDTLERMEPLFEGAGCLVQLSTCEPLQGRWDPLRLDQIFVNLLSNAVKYGAGKPVRLAVATEQDQVVLQVRDEGIGIPPGALPRLFGRFERAVSDRHYGGLGLGLYITRQIALAMGGTVTCESPVEGGALFTVKLPLSPS